MGSEKGASTVKKRSSYSWPKRADFAPWRADFLAFPTAPTSYLLETQNDAKFAICTCTRTETAEIEKYGISPLYDWTVGYKKEGEIWYFAFRTFPGAAHCGM